LKIEYWLFTFNCLLPTAAATAYFTNSNFHKRVSSSGSPFFIIFAILNKKPMVTAEQMKDLAKRLDALRRFL
jgi:hypothetical protein